MSAFRDPSATLLQRIDLLERENSRLRRRARLRTRGSIRAAGSFLLQLIGVIAFIFLALVLCALVTGILAAIVGVTIAHA